MYRVRTVFKNQRIWYEIYDNEDNIIFSVKAYKRAVELQQILNKGVL